MARSKLAHLCLTCSCYIVNTPEVQVKMKVGVRYRHENAADCAAALRHPPGQRPFPKTRGRHQKGRRKAAKHTGLRIARANDIPVMTPEEFDAR